jgi:hypothetical protein
MMTGNPRLDRNAGVKVARELRKLGFRSGPASKRAGKTRPKAAGTSMAQRAAQIRDFFDGQPKGEDRQGLDPNQRVHLHAFAVKQMLDAQTKTHALANAILNAASPHYPDAGPFFDLIDQMLTWTPDKSRKGTGFDTDFAAKARKTLDSLDKHLGKAVERLTALQARLKERKTTPAP